MSRSLCQVLCDVRLKGRGGKWLGGVNKEIEKWSCLLQANLGRGGGDGEQHCKGMLRMLSITSSGITFTRKEPQKLQLIPVVGHVSALPEQSAYFYLKESISLSFLRLMPETSGPNLKPISDNFMDIWYLFHALLSLLAPSYFPYFLFDSCLLALIFKALNLTISLHFISQLKSFSKHFQEVTK